ncbi:FAD-dependent oxidoreductase [Salinirubellus salinus]|uniref:FAD-dependent oxidoreductase n=1 Tax=Salinirubellus salinus TaxID=1364945 RepID=A0A9E7R6V9_9EURY|nr:FAD-dependent oxidoreductase [Salinirubellus salinus]UWM55778.1 FAD-dependent oxidoreductase [Salinirubellus salinus]
MTDTFVVVGGDAAGMSAASKAKRDHPDLEVVVFEKGEWVSYGACGMPYYVEGTVADLDELISLTPEEIIEDRDIDLRRFHEVVAVDTVARTVTVRNEDGTFEQGYDHLLLATGAAPTTPPVEGVDLDCVFTLSSLDDAEGIREALEAEEVTEDLVGSSEGAVVQFIRDRDPKRVAVVGGGYIGLEMADVLRTRGCSVHLFQRSDHVLSHYDEDVATVVEEHLREHGVTLHLGSAVEGIEGDAAGDAEAVVAEDGRTEVDMVVLGTGVRPRTALAEEAGIDLGPTGAIATDEYRETSAPDVYAAGDCAEAVNVVTGEVDYVPLALTANRHGRAVGQTVAGTPTLAGGVARTAISMVVEMEVARTGITDEDEAREYGFDPVSRTVTTKSRSGYYPGSEPITVHMTACRRTGRLLGASIAGTDRAGKRIDTVAAALHEEATVAELERYDLAYAPPFSPVWDPVLTAAKVLNSAVEGE